MKFGVFGGTFDPIHHGHVAPARDAADLLGLDTVLFLPTARPPHKDGPRGATAAQRFAMVELALLDEPELEASDLEMGTGAPTYTVDTLEALRAERPGDEPVLLLGGDSFVQLPAWRRWTRILELVEIAVLVRPGWRWNDEDLEPAQRQAVAAGRVHLVEDEPVSLSASDLRQRLARGEVPMDGSIHPRVLRYILKYGLYGADRQG